MIVAALRATSLTMALLMLVSWALYGISSPLVLYFGLIAGVSGIDQTAVRGIRISMEGRRDWPSQYLPPLALLHIGVVVLIVSVVYGLVFTSIVGILLGSAGTFLTYVRYNTSARTRKHEQ